MNKNKHWYLASPYSHEQDLIQRHRYELVVSHTAFLTSAGILVYSPIAHCRSMALLGELPHSWNAWKEHNFSMIEKLDGVRVLMIDGWKSSKGVDAEMRHAEECNKPVIFDIYRELP